MPPRWPVTMTRRLIVRITAITAVALLSLVGVLPASAQSLGEAAQKEAARRKSLKGPVKVVTNDDLKAVPQTTPPPGTPAPAEGATPPATGGEPGTAAPEAGAAPGAAGEAEPAPAEAAKDEAYWRQRITEARQQRDQNAFLIDAVQTRINVLTADFSARDDPFQRAKIGEERQRTLAELDRMKRNQADLEKRIAGIEEEARRANVPPGWLR